MKKSLGRLLLSREFQLSIFAPLLRSMVRATDGGRYSAEFLVDFQATARPHYGYCLIGAARLARRLGLERISAIEFGVAGGNGLKFMCDFARRVTKSTGVAIDCYGFDTGKGMPPPQGARDLPYWFQAAQYPMDEGALRALAPDAKLVIGEIKDTLPGFLQRFDPAPIGMIVNDTDYWSSTLDLLRLFDGAAARPQNFMPRLFMYFDDILGGENEMYGPFNGGLAAIEDYHKAQDGVRLHLNQNLLPSPHLPWRHQIYYAHLFKHPRYSQYIGADDQAPIEAQLKLRADAAA